MYKKCMLNYSSTIKRTNVITTVIFSLNIAGNVSKSSFLLITMQDDSSAV